MSGIVGRIHSIESFGTVDGPGVRYVLFLQGCELRCRYCHNPDTWTRTDGYDMTSDEAVADILTYLNFIREGGVTFSGGEPLLQPEFVSAVIDGCHENGLHTALDTAGSVPLEHSRGTIDKSDLLLLDIKALDPALCREITGRDNANELATLEYCETYRKPVWIRHVVVPGLTFDSARLTALADYLLRFSCVKRIDLLPFHKLGEYKWAELRYPYTLTDTPALTPAELTQARAPFAARSLPLGPVD